MRRQRMDIDSFVVPEQDTPKTTPKAPASSLPGQAGLAIPYEQGAGDRNVDKIGTQAEEAYVADLLVVADERIGVVQEELECVKNERDLAEQKIESLKHQVKSSRICVVKQSFKLFHNGCCY